MSTYSKTDQPDIEQSENQDKKSYEWYNLFGNKEPMAPPHTENIINEPGTVDTTDNTNTIDNTDDTDTIDNTDDTDTIDNTDNTDIYVIMVNNTPAYYTKTEDSATQKMWDIARDYSLGYFSDGWNTEYVKINNGHLQLLGSFRYFLINYDKVLMDISYHLVEKLV